jgi:hypothetical protein
MTFENGMWRKLVALLLVPCLIADSALAAATVTSIVPPHVVREDTPGSSFQTEAFTLPILFGMVHSFSMHAKAAQTHMAVFLTPRIQASIYSLHNAISALAIVGPPILVGFIVGWMVDLWARRKGVGKDHWAYRRGVSIAKAKLILNILCLIFIDFQSYVKGWIPAAAFFSSGLLFGGALSNGLQVLRFGGARNFLRGPDREALYNFSDYIQILALLGYCGALLFRDFTRLVFDRGSFKVADLIASLTLAVVAFYRVSKVSAKDRHIPPAAPATNPGSSALGPPNRYGDRGRPEMTPGDDPGLSFPPHTAPVAENSRSPRTVEPEIDPITGTVVPAIPSVAAKDNFLATRAMARRIPMWMLSEAVGLSARQILGDSPEQRMRPEQLLYILDRQGPQAIERLKRYLDVRPSHWREAHAFVAEYALAHVQEPLVATGGVQRDELAHRLAVLLRPLVITHKAPSPDHTWGFRIQSRRGHLKDLFELAVDSVYDPDLAITTEGGQDALSEKSHVLEALLSLEQFERDPQEKRLLNSAIRRLSRADFTKIDLSQWESTLTEVGLNRSRHWGEIQEDITGDILHVAVCEISARTDEWQDDYLRRLEKVRPLLRDTETFDYIFDYLDSTVYAEVEAELRQAYVGSLKGFRPTEGMARRAIARAERRISESWFPGILEEYGPNQVGDPRREWKSLPGPSEPGSSSISGADLLKEGERLNSLSVGDRFEELAEAIDRALATAHEFALSAPPTAADELHALPQDLGESILMEVHDLVEDSS